MRMHGAVVRFRICLLAWLVHPALAHLLARIPFHNDDIERAGALAEGEFGQSMIPHSRHFALGHCIYQASSILLVDCHVRTMRTDVPLAVLWGSHCRDVDSACRAPLTSSSWPATQ